MNFLPVLITEDECKDSTVDYLLGLVLEKVEGNVNKYVRVGLFSISVAENIREFMDAVERNGGREDECDLGESVGIDAEGRALYSITIV